MPARLRRIYTAAAAPALGAAALFIIFAFFYHT